MTWAELHARYEAFLNAHPPSNLQPRYNIAPTQQALIIRKRDEGREAAMCRFGLIPSWSKGPDPKFTNINARAETVEKAAPFRNAFKRHRCLVPASGFYEWRKEGEAKQPYYFYPAKGPAFTFAGLWDSWKGPEGDVESFAIITTDANEAMRPYHDRMPVILGADTWEFWLAQGGKELLRPCPNDALEVRRVSKRVNSPAQDDAGLIEAA
jgi:putative SOS response-associated peptidase YedK